MVKKKIIVIHLENSFHIFDQPLTQVVTTSKIFKRIEILEKEKKINPRVKLNFVLLSGYSSIQLIFYLFFIFFYEKKIF